MPRNSRPPNSSLYIRNIPDEARADEIRDMFSKYGLITDVYIPLDYYTRRPRGFAYVQYEDPRDADDALYYLNHVRYLGTELDIEIARSDRKTPQAMRYKEHGRPPYHNSRYDDYDDYRRRDRSVSRSPKRHHSRNRSRSPYRKRSWSRSHSRSHPRKHGESSKRRSRSESPADADGK